MRFLDGRENFLLGDGEVEDRLNSRTLNRNTLFASISEEINAMPEDAYIGLSLIHISFKKY